MTNQEKEKKHQWPISGIQVETIDSADAKITREYWTQYYAKKINTLDEMVSFLEKHNLSKVIQN